MVVVFQGGTSGNREDALAKVPTSGTPQPILRTQTSSPIPSTVIFNAEHFDQKPNREQVTPDFLPTGGTVANPNGNGGTSSEDYSQQDIAGLKFDPSQGEGTIFRGAPNTGMGLGRTSTSEGGAT